MKYVKLGWLNDCVMSFILFSSVPGLPAVYKQCDTKTVDIVHAYLQNILAKSNSSLASSHIQVSYTSRRHLFLICMKCSFIVGKIKSRGSATCVKQLYTSNTIWLISISAPC